MKKRMCSLLLTLALVLGLLPASALAASPIPFTATADGHDMAIVQSDTDYTYTVVTEYDENWNPVQTEQHSVELYVITNDTYVITPDTQTVVLDFGEQERLAYGYDANGNYLAAYAPDGAYANNGQTGETTAVITGTLPDYVRVQTPYDASWNSQFLYAITFEGGQAGPEEPDTSSVSVQALLENIAAGYVENSGDWIVMDMAAYQALDPAAQSKTSSSAKQACIDAAISAITADSVGETTYSKAILALQAIGADPQTLYPENSTASISAVAGLKSLSAYGSSAWVAPYTLAAFNQGEYGTDDTEQTILNSVLANQAADGSWSEWGDSIQTTANMLAGLAFYYGEDAAVTAAVDKAVAYLSSAQKEDGSFDAYGYGSDSNTVAMVVIGLSAVGINPDTDPRFIKGDTSAMDNLLSFALSDNSGFGYTNNTALNSYSTEQGFRALIAASQVMNTGAAYNVYDFSANTLSPAYAGGQPSSGGQGGGSSDSGDEITVSFTLKTHLKTWIPAHDVTVDEDATVADLFFQVLDTRDDQFSYVNKNGYISSITYEAETWAEFDAGTNSGWKYMVNGTAPSVGMGDKYLEDGDKVVWYYVTDYTQDTGRDEDDFGKEEEEPADQLPFTDVESHWAYAAMEYCYNLGLMSGTSQTTFAPNATLNRAMAVTILYNLEGKPSQKDSAPFADVADDTWYTDAVAWAAENGVVSGYDANTFGPLDNVTREQLSAILHNYAQYKSQDVSVGEDTNILSYTDAFSISDWAFPALQWACGAGLISGYPDGALLPQGTATRAETAAILMNYLESNE